MPLVRFDKVTGNSGNITRGRFTVIEGEDELTAFSKDKFYDQLVCRAFGDNKESPSETNFDDLQFFDKYALSQIFSKTWRNQHQAIRQNVAVANIIDMKPGEKGAQSVATLEIVEFPPLQLRHGEILRILPRLVDFNLPKILENLIHIDKEATNKGEIYFLSLLQSPKQVGTRQIPMHNLLLSKEQKLTRIYNERRRISDDVIPLIFKKSQRKAMDSILRQHMTIIWGPPGTGKTHTLALSIIYYLQAAYESIW